MRVVHVLMCEGIEFPEDTRPVAVYTDDVEAQNAADRYMTTDPRFYWVDTVELVEREYANV